LYWSLVPAVLLLSAPALQAQVAPPHIGYVYPAGGQQGTTLEVKLGGQYFNEAAEVEVSGAGVTARVLRVTRPLKQAEITALTTQLKSLEEKATKTDDEKKEIEKIREQLTGSAVPATPVLAENVFVEVTIAKTATPGPRELRLHAKTGMSNPIVFDVGQLPEVRQKKEIFDPENRPPRRGPARFVKRREVVHDSEVKVTLPSVLNSQLMPGEVDHYRFSAKAGQLLVFRTRARALIPYLADAVPGWIQAVLTLYDAEGTEVAFNDDFADKPDPVLAYKVPRDGEYVLEIHDALYRGREDFVYRIEAGELPLITGIYPLGGKAGVATPVTLQGWNLPRPSLILEAKDLKPGIIPVSIEGKGLLSNQVPFQVTTLPEIEEKEPNDTIATAQMVTLPIIVNGKINKPGDWDVFRFDGEAGRTVVAEVWARRLDSPLDSYLKLTDGEGKVLAFNDDMEDRGQGLMTHHADSRLQSVLPKNGTYYIQIGDARRHGGADHAYRLRISPPRPDFELRLTPCSINVRPGSTVPVTVSAIRKDGFSGEIHVVFKYTPVGFLLEGAIIPANQNEVRITVQVPPTPRPKPIQLDMEGWAMVSGQRVTRPVVAAEDMMQAFAYHHLVPANHLLVTVSNEARARFPARLLHTQPIKIRPGGSAVVRFSFPKGGGSDKLQLILNEPPEGLSLKSSSINADGATLTLHADSEKVKPGLRTNLIVEVYPESGKAGKTTRFPLGTLPAIPVEVFRPGR
jgi:hypothetical protein